MDLILWNRRRSKHCGHNTDGKMCMYENVHEVLIFLSFIPGFETGLVYVFKGLIMSHLDCENWDIPACGDNRGLT